MFGIPAPGKQRQLPKAGWPTDTTYVVSSMLVKESASKKRFFKVDGNQ